MQYSTLETNNTMEQIIVNLVLAVTSAIPDVIKAVKASTVLNTEEKEALLNALSDRLHKSVEEVKAVKFKDVDNE